MVYCPRALSQNGRREGGPVDPPSAVAFRQRPPLLLPGLRLCRRFWPCPMRAYFRLPSLRPIVPLVREYRPHCIPQYLSITGIKLTSEASYDSPSTTRVHPSRYLRERACHFGVAPRILPASMASIDVRSTSSLMLTALPLQGEPRSCCCCDAARLLPRVSCALCSLPASRACRAYSRASS